MNRKNAVFLLVVIAGLTFLQACSGGCYTCDNKETVYYECSKPGDTVKLVLFQGLKMTEEEIKYYTDNGYSCTDSIVKKANWGGDDDYCYSEKDISYFRWDGYNCHKQY